MPSGGNEQDQLVAHLNQLLEGILAPFITKGSFTDPEHTKCNWYGSDVSTTFN